MSQNALALLKRRDNKFSLTLRCIENDCAVQNTYGTENYLFSYSLSSIKIFFVLKVRR